MLFKEVLEINREEIKMDVRLKDLPGWDSIAAISFMAMVDTDYGVKLTGEDIRQAVTVEDLFNLIQNNKGRRGK